MGNFREDEPIVIETIGMWQEAFEAMSRTMCENSSTDFALSLTIVGRYDQSMPMIEDHVLANINVVLAGTVPDSCKDAELTSLLEAALADVMGPLADRQRDLRK